MVCIRLKAEEDRNSRDWQHQQGLGEVANRRYVCEASLQRVKAETVIWVSSYRSMATSSCERVRVGEVKPKESRSGPRVLNILAG